MTIGPARIDAEWYAHLLLTFIMPSHRRRSPSRDRSNSPSRDRSRSRSPERKAPLPDGVSEISEVDYFLKNDEFQVWLKEEKGKVR